MDIKTFCIDGAIFSVRVLILQVITENEKKIFSYFHFFLSKLYRILSR
jgi:hypothetical protein